MIVCTVLNKQSLFVPVENGDGMSYSKCARGQGAVRSWPLTADPERSCDPEHSRRRRPSLSLRPLLRYGTDTTVGPASPDWVVGPVDPSIRWPPHVGSFLSRSVLLDCYGYRQKLKFSRTQVRTKPKTYSGTWGRYGVDGIVKFQECQPPLIRRLGLVN